MGAISGVISIWVAMGIKFTDTPWLVLLAAKPWSPESHSLFPLLLREQALRAFWTLKLLFRKFLPNDASSEMVYLVMSFLIDRKGFYPRLLSRSRPRLGETSGLAL